MVQLADGVEFSFTDKRRFAKVRLLENVICETVYHYAEFYFLFPSTNYMSLNFQYVHVLLQPVSLPPISELGPDALTEPMTEDEFLSSLKKKTLGIKALLLDQVLMIYMYEYVECKGYKNYSYTVLFLLHQKSTDHFHLVIQHSKF